jgi:hypothetical protein
MAADELVHLAAHVDPPVGFESRLFDELHSTDSGSMSASKRSRRSKALVAVAAAVVVAFGFGWVVHTSTAAQRHVATVSQPGRDDRTASLVSEGRSLGDVSVYGHAPAWLFVVVDASPGIRTVRCTVISANGAAHYVGTFALTDGRGTWTAPLWIGKSPVTSTQLVDSAGRVVAVGKFP